MVHTCQIKKTLLFLLLFFPLFIYPQEVHRPIRTWIVPKDGEVRHANNSRIYKVVVVTYEAEALAYFARISDWGAFSPLQITTRKGLLNTLIKKGKTNGWWVLLDDLQIYAAASQQMAKLNMIKDGSNASTVNSPTFTIDKGYNGNGVDSYVNTNFNPSTDGVNYTLNGAFFGVGCLTDATSPPYTFSCGTITTNYIFIYPNYGSAGNYGVYGGVNDLTFGHNWLFNTSKGFSWAERVSNAYIYVGRNDYYGVPIADVVTGLPTSTLFMCGRNASGVLAQPHNWQYNLFVVGGTMGIEKRLALYNDLNAYLIAIVAGW